MRKDGHHPVLIVIAGPNGSGKTTVTSQLLKSDWLEDAIYINPDIIANEKFGDWNSPDAVRRAAEYCSEMRELCLVQRKSLIYVYDNSADNMPIQPLFRLSDGILGKMYVKSLPDWASNILPGNEIQDSEISD